MMRRIARDWLCIAVCMTLLFSFTRVERLTGYGVIAESSDYNANGDYDIEIEPDQTCKMIRCHIDKAVLSLPCMIDGYPVREIGAGCFSGRDALRHIVVPSSVYTIDEYAFEGARMLTTVVIPETVQEIGGNAFATQSGNKLFRVLTASGSYAADYCRNHGVGYIESRERSLRLEDELSLRMEGYVRLGENYTIAPENMFNNLASDVVSELSFFDAALYGIADRDNYVNSLMRDLLLGDVNSYIKDLYVDQIARLLSRVNSHKTQDTSSLVKSAGVNAKNVGNIAYLEDYWRINWVFEDPAGVKEALGILSTVCDKTSFALDVIDSFGADFKESVSTLKLLKQVGGGTSYPEAWDKAVEELALKYNSRLHDAIIKISSRIENGISKAIIETSRDLTLFIAGEAAGSLYKVANIIIDTGLSLFNLKEKSKNFMIFAVCLEMDSYFNDQYRSLFDHLSNSDYYSDAELIDLNVLYNLAREARLQLFDAELAVTRNNQTRTSINRYATAYEKISIDPDYFQMKVCYGDGTLLGSKYQPIPKDEPLMNNYEINFDGLAAWWAGSNEALREYIEERDRTYGRTENLVSTINPPGIPAGYEMNDWINVFQGKSDYFNLFCDIIAMGYGKYDFTDKHLELIESELLGWGASDGVPELRDEYYLFEIRGNGITDRICVRMTNENSVGIQARLYDSQETDHSIETTTNEQPSVSTTEEVYYGDSLYAMYNNISDSDYRAQVGEMDARWGRTAVVYGSVDGFDIGYCGMLQGSAIDAQSLLSNLLSSSFYVQGSSGIENLLNGDYYVSLWQTELYAWGSEAGRSLVCDEYYRFGILTRGDEQYEIYDAIFRVGYESNGGDWAEGRIINVSLEPIVSSDSPDAEITPLYEFDEPKVEAGPLYYKWNEYALLDFWSNGVGGCDIEQRSNQYSASENLEYVMDNGVAIGQVGGMYGYFEQNAREWLIHVADEERWRWNDQVLSFYLAQQLGDGDTVEVTGSELYGWYMGKSVDGYDMYSYEEFYEVVVTLYSTGIKYDIMFDMTSTFDEGDSLKSLLVEASQIEGWTDPVVPEDGYDDEAYAEEAYVEEAYEEETYEDAYADQEGDDYNLDFGTGYDVIDNQGEYAGTLTVVNCNEWVSLRSAPDSDSDRVAEVPLWADVEAYYWNSEWYECQYNGVWGYIRSDYLTDWPEKYDGYYEYFGVS